MKSSIQRCQSMTDSEEQIKIHVYVQCIQNHEADSREKAKEVD